MPGMKEYASPFRWPALVHGHPLKLGPFDPCATCGGTGSWVRYGGVVTCLICANAAVRRAAFEVVG
jgi:hypothetical protein